jgi:hypothetical protein
MKNIEIIVLSILIAILCLAVVFLFYTDTTTNKKQLQLNNEILKVRENIKYTEDSLNRNFNKKILEVDSESTKKQNLIHKKQDEDLLIKLKKQEGDLMKIQKNNQEENLKLFDQKDQQMKSYQQSTEKILGEQQNNLLTYQKQNDDFHNKLSGTIGGYDKAINEISTNFSNYQKSNQDNITKVQSSLAANENMFNKKIETVINDNKKMDIVFQDYRLNNENSHNSIKELIVRNETTGKEQLQKFIKDIDIINATLASKQKEIASNQLKPLKPEFEAINKILIERDVTEATCKTGKCNGDELNKLRNILFTKIRDEVLYKKWVIAGNVKNKIMAKYKQNGPEFVIAEAQMMQIPPLDAKIQGAINSGNKLDIDMLDFPILNEDEIIQKVRGGDTKTTKDITQGGAKGDILLGKDVMIKQTSEQTQTNEKAAAIREVGIKFDRNNKVLEKFAQLGENSAQFKYAFKNMSMLRETYYALKNGKAVNNNVINETLRTPDISEQGIIDQVIKEGGRLTLRKPKYPENIKNFKMVEIPFLSRVMELLTVANQSQKNLILNTVSSSDIRVEQPISYAGKVWGQAMLLTASYIGWFNLGNNDGVKSRNININISTKLPLLNEPPNNKFMLQSSQVDKLINLIRSNNPSVVVIPVYRRSTSDNNSKMKDVYSLDLVQYAERIGIDFFDISDIIILLIDNNYNSQSECTINVYGKDSL